MMMTIEGTFPSLNRYIDAERSSRYAAADIKRANTDYVVYNVRQHPPITEKSNFTFTWYVKDKRRDPDNIAFAQKFIFDGLVIAKVLPADTMQWVGSIHHHFAVDKDNPRVEIEVSNDRQS